MAVSFFNSQHLRKRMDPTACLQSSAGCRRMTGFVLHLQTPADVLCTFCNTRQLNVTDYSSKKAVALGTEDIKGVRTRQ